MEYRPAVGPCFDVSTLQATAGFEKDVMRARSVVIGGALAAIILGLSMFVMGLRQPTEMRVGMSSPSIELNAR